MKERSEAPPLSTMVSLGPEGLNSAVQFLLFVLLRLTQITANYCFARCACSYSCFHMQAMASLAVCLC